MVTDLRAVLFDAAGVLTAGFALELVEPAIAAGADPEVLMGRLYPIFASGGSGNSIGNRLERGEVTLEEFLASLGDDEGHCRMVLDPASDHFFGNHWMPDLEMQNFVREVHDAGFATGLVTNNVREWQPVWDRLIPADLPFGTRVFSWDARTRKPEPAIYHLALSALGVEPDEAVLLDDFAAMTQGARSIGMHAIDVTDASTAIAEARALLGL